MILPRLLRKNLLLQYDYLESWHYFAELKQEYNVKTVTGVHVRHGDVKNEKGARLVLLNKEYYLKAMDRV